MNKKADLAINYTFLVFIGVIAVFVIIGMLTNWKLISEKAMNAISKNPEPALVDSKIIATKDIFAFKREIIKQSKLCSEYAKSGYIKGELCYAIVCESNCNVACSDIDFENEVGKNKVSCYMNMPNSKAIIGFDYSTQKVVIY
ncbi:MAG: hypothetical protein V1859_09305 [archaeon]